MRVNQLNFSPFPLFNEINTKIVTREKLNNDRINR